MSCQGEADPEKSCELAEEVNRLGARRNVQFVVESPDACAVLPDNSIALVPVSVTDHQQPVSRLPAAVLL
jgi:hypothetical protein